MAKNRIQQICNALKDWSSQPFLPDAKPDLKKRKKQKALPPNQLPWRLNITPYRVYISEMMLQQTRVSTVINYFQRWMVLFPNWEKLSQSSLTEILSCWQGLGYYSRAERIHKVAQILKKSNFLLPKTKKELLKLPGVGEYTANAILSLAYGQKVLAFDANLKRVAARLLGLDQTENKKTEQALSDFLKQFLPFLPAPDLNSILMDFGRLLCTARFPQCEPCPLQKHCLGFQKNKSPFPALAAQKLPSKKLILADLHFFLVQKNEKILMQQARKNAWWVNLYSFPYSLQPETKEQNQLTSSVQSKQKGDSSHFFLKMPSPFSFLHLPYQAEGFVTKYKLKISLFFMDIPEENKNFPFPSLEKKAEQDKKFLWIHREEFFSLPMPSPMQKISLWLKQQGWPEKITQFVPERKIF